MDYPDNLPAGMFYKHICPGCGKFEYLYSNDIWVASDLLKFNSG